MISVGLISWWYGDGLRIRYKSAIEKTAELFDFFSIGILIRTLFSPYKQISANEKAESISQSAGVVLDKFVSRIVGFFVRLLIMISGVIALLVQQIIHVVTIIGWLVIPFMPLIGVILAISGWGVPWTI